MYKYNLDVLVGFFQDDSIQKLQYIFENLNNYNITAEDSIRLKQYFLSIIENEKKLHNMPSFNSPDGMNFKNVFVIILQTAMLLFIILISKKSTLAVK